MSTTVSPVTQTAEVAVKIASTKEVNWPSLFAHGLASNKPPTRIAPKNPNATTWAGCASEICPRLCGGLDEFARIVSHRSKLHRAYARAGVTNEILRLNRVLSSVICSAY